MSSNFATSTCEEVKSPKNDYWNKLNVLTINYSTQVIHWENAKDIHLSGKEGVFQICSLLFIC